MGSESESKDLEVKKAHTRTRSKQKQDKEEDLVPISTNDNSKIMDKSSNGIEKTGRKGRGKRSHGAIDASNKEIENKEEQNVEKTRKTRQGNRSTSKKPVSQDEANLKESTTKMIKKDSTVVEDDEEQIDNEEGNTDPKKPKKPSKRQVKREKAEQRETLKKEASRLEATEKALNYVSKWKHVRSEWKFEKLRQIWLMDNLLDKELIPDEIFPTVLEYFEGCKGMAREQLLKKGMDVIRKQEENEEASKEEATESVEYNRARQLLQALPTET